MKVIVEDEKLNEEALLFSFSVFFFLLSRVTSEVGWATPKKKKTEKKKKKNQTPTPSSPFSSPLFLLPLFKSPPSFVKN